MGDRARRGKVALVTGGAGFIGSHLLATLASSRDYETLVSVDTAEPRIRIEGVDYRHLDVRQPLPDDLCPAPPDIFNLAAIHITPGHPDHEYGGTNRPGASNVCDYARRVGVRNIVFSSSISVYGAGEDPKTEASPPAPDSVYGVSKLAAEDIHLRWLDEARDTRRLIIARPAAIYGPGERGNFTRLARLLSRNRFFFPGRRDTIKACGYVDDLTASFLFMLDRSERLLIYNFAHRDPPSSEEICAAICRAAGYRARPPVLPLPLMRMAALGFEGLNAIGLKNSINRARIMKLYRSTNIRPQLLQDLGFEWRYSLESSFAHWLSQTPTGRFD